MTDRTIAEDLALLVTELVDEVVTSETYDWQQGNVRERRTHTLREPGLLTQLELAAGRRELRPNPGAPLQPVALVQNRYAGTATVTYRSEASAEAMVDAGSTGQIMYGEGGHTKPGSKTPGQAVYGDTLTDIETAVARIRRDLRAKVGRSRGARVDTPTALREIVGLALVVDDDTAEKARRQLRALAGAARVALSYQAPMIELASRCPTCGGKRKVRQDASGAVYCVGHGPREPCPVPYDPDWWANGCDAYWPRLYWLEIADQEQIRRLHDRPRHEVEAEAWAEHAAWLAEADSA